MVPGLVGESPEWVPRFEALGVFAANAVPLLGVGALGWQPATLILLYWVEFSVVLLAAVVRAAFAGRPSELDGDPLVFGALARRSLHATVPRTDIGIRISSVPVLLIATPLLALLWFAVSGVTVGVVGVAEPEQPEWLLGLAVLTIIAAEVGRTGFEYFYQRAYREHSAQTALQGVLFRGTALFFIGICVVVVAAPADASASSAIRTPGTVGGPLLFGIVGLKTALDLVDQYADRLEAYDEATDVPLGVAYDPPTDSEVDGVSEDAARVRPTLFGRLFGGIPGLVRHPNTAVVGVFLGLIALLFAIGRAWSVAVTLAAAAVVVPFGLSSADHWLRYAGVEYRVDGDAIVAYDRLFRQPLWRVEPWDERDLRVEHDWLDGRFGTETVVVELDDDTLRLPHLADPETVLATFDRRPDRPAG